MNKQLKQAKKDYKKSLLNSKFHNSELTRLRSLFIEHKLPKWGSFIFEDLNMNINQMDFNDKKDRFINKLAIIVSNNSIDRYLYFEKYHNVILSLYDNNRKTDDNFFDGYWKYCLISEYFLRMLVCNKIITKQEYVNINQFYNFNDISFYMKNDSNLIIFISLLEKAYKKYKRYLNKQKKLNESYNN